MTPSVSVMKLFIQLSPTAKQHKLECLHLINYFQTSLLLSNHVYPVYLAKTSNIRLDQKMEGNTPAYFGPPRVTKKNFYYDKCQCYKKISFLADNEAT